MIDELEVNVRIVEGNKRTKKIVIGKLYTAEEYQIKEKEEFKKV